jgi:hypothetical protein
MYHRAKVRNIFEITKSYIYIIGGIPYIFYYTNCHLCFRYINPTITNPTSVGFFIQKTPDAAKHRGN